MKIKNPTDLLMHCMGLFQKMHIFQSSLVLSIIFFLKIMNISKNIFEGWHSSSFSSKCLEISTKF